MTALRLLLLFALIFAAPVSVDAQYDRDYGGRDRYFDDRGRWGDRQPDQRQGQRADQSDRQGERNIAGEFDYYALVLSWSPTYCATAQSGKDDMQCNRRDGRRYAFVLHGLWPQYERGYPESCRTRRKPFVPQPVIDSMLDIMPSPGLVIHEYRKHGTCSGLDAGGYYDLSRRLYQSIRIPERFVNPYETQFVSPDQFVFDFVSANPQFKRNMIAVSCGGSGSRMKEVRICLTKDGRPRACGSNEDQRRLCSAANMFVPPVRSRGTVSPGERPGSTSPSPSRRPSPENRPENRPDSRPDSLPGPRLIEGSRGI